MQIVKYETEEDWLAARPNHITGSKLGDIVPRRGLGKKIGFYQLVADRLSNDTDMTSDRDRGHELEAEAVAQLAKHTDLTFITDLVIWRSDANPYMAYSPDGFTDDLKFAAEAKCLGTAKYLKSLIEDKIPDEYREQVIQAFVVNDELERLYFILYDPRVTVQPYHVITFEREDLADEIEYYKQCELKVLAEVDDIVAKLAF
jgi:hypothetical protein